MTDVQKIAFDTLKAGAPGLSDQTREALAGSIARKVALSTTPARAEAQDEGAAGERDKRAWIDRWNAIEGAAQDALHTMTELLEAPNLKRMQYALGERRDALANALNLPEAGTAWMRPANPSPTPAADADRVREATGAEAVIRDEQIVISIDVDALPGILSGSIATNSVAGLFKVTDPAEFAKEVCRALNAEKEDGTTRVHMMFDSAFNHAIDQGAEGVEEVTEDEFEAEAQRIQSKAITALKSTAAKEGGE